MWEANDGCFSPSLPPSIPLSLKINKGNLFLKWLKKSTKKIVVTLLSFEGLCRKDN